MLTDHQRALASALDAIKAEADRAQDYNPYVLALLERRLDPAVAALDGSPGLPAAAGEALVLVQTQWRRVRIALAHARQHPQLVSARTLALAELSAFAQFVRAARRCFNVLRHSPASPVRPVAMQVGLADTTSGVGSIGAHGPVAPRTPGQIVGPVKANGA
jgi:hypothetical protein